MRIVIDGRMYQESGIGRYIRNLLLWLQKLDTKNEYHILHTEDDYDTLVYHKNFKKVLADFSWYGVREQVRIPKLLGLLKPDLVHFPHFNVPIFYKGKFIVTIHDLIHQHYSMQRSTTHGALIYKIKQLGYKNVFRHVIEKSEKILVPSNFIKKQLIQGWKVDSSKIIVTPEAVDDKLLSQDSDLSETNQQYIFYVGNAHPHKNVEGLIKAFLLLKKEYKDLCLVLAGYDHYFWQKIKKDYDDESIIYKGFVSDKELVTLYKNARVFVMPSFDEGFGLPLLEAFALKCPVVSSNAGALPEVGGDACIYFNPDDMGDMVDKIDQVLKSEKLRKELIDKGLEKVELFSWEKLARQTLKVYEKCVLQ